MDGLVEGRGAGRYADVVAAGEPLGAEILCTFDLPGPAAESAGGVGELRGVVAVVSQVLTLQAKQLL